MKLIIKLKSCDSYREEELNLPDIEVKAKEISSLKKRDAVVGWRMGRASEGARTGD